MPIYEYRCQNCGEKLEILQKHADAPLTECPKCGKEDLNKLVSAPSFQLKGSGWYVTDFKDKSKKPTEKKEEKSTEKEQKTPDKKADKKEKSKDKED